MIKLHDNIITQMQNYKKLSQCLVSSMLFMLFLMVVASVSRFSKTGVRVYVT